MCTQQCTFLHSNNTKQLVVPKQLKLLSNLVGLPDSLVSDRPLKSNGQIGPRSGHTQSYDCWFWTVSIMKHCIVMSLFRNMQEKVTINIICTESCSLRIL